MTSPSNGDLVTVFSGSLQLNGLTTAGDRVWAVSQGDTRSPTGARGPQVIEIIDGEAVPYPNEEWSRWQNGDDVDGHFVGVNSIRIGPDGLLWVVDRGATGIGEQRVDFAPRLIGFDLESNTMSRVFDLQGATRPWSFVDDVRFNGDVAYLTDAGAPAIIVLHLPTGEARRVLEGHPSTVSQQPLRAEHRELRTPEARPVNIHVDQLEVSPDGRWLYYQPCSGTMSRIKTSLIDNPETSERTLAEAVDVFALTNSTGGTAIDADGTIYVSDTDNSRITTVSPEGDITVLLEDVRLAWIDAMWIDDDGRLLMPSAQLNRGADLNGGIDTVTPPCVTYAYPTGSHPVRS